MKASRYLLTFAAALALLSSVSAPSKAEDLFSIGIGKMNVLDSDEQVDFRTEYRWGEPLLWQIRPFVGLEGNSDGAIYGLGGINWDWGFSPHWYLTPSFGAGLWHDSGDPDLGSTIEFRSQIEVAYEFSNMHRISAGFGHISNAGIGDRNPGTEIVHIQWHVPVNWWSGK